MCKHKYTSDPMCHRQHDLWVVKDALRAVWFVMKPLRKMAASHKHHRDPVATNIWRVAAGITCPSALLVRRSMSTLTPSAAPARLSHEAKPKHLLSAYPAPDSASSVVSVPASGLLHDMRTFQLVCGLQSLVEFVDQAATPPTCN